MAATASYESTIDPAVLLELGQGAEGRVFGLANDPLMAYKEYFTVSHSPPNLEAMRRLVDLPSRWEESARRWIFNRTAWPRTAITDGERLRGYLMGRIPNEFFFTHGLVHRPRSVLCDWNYLSMRDRFRHNDRLVSDIPSPTSAEVSRLLLDLARTLAVLHRHNVIAGDLSGRNILWTNSPDWRILLIDCDGFRLRGTAAVNFSKETPDWEDPEVAGSHTSERSDVYKLGLAAYRALWAATTNLPPPGLDTRAVPAGSHPALHSLISRSTSRSDRPSADEWVATLSDFPTQERVKPSPVPVPPHHHRTRTRPTIRLTQPGQSDESS